jgi:hypothetical protein
MRFAGKYYNTFKKYSLYEVSNLIKGVLYEGVIVPSSKPHKESTL